MSREDHEYSLTRSMGDIVRNLTHAFQCADHARAYDHLLKAAHKNLQQAVEDLQSIYDHEREVRENSEKREEKDRESYFYLHQQIDDLKKQLFERQ